MAGEMMRGRGIAGADAPALAMANKFSRYRPETEQNVRKVEIAEDQMLKKLKKAWKAIPPKVYLHDFYNVCLKRLRGSGHSASDVERFSIALAGFQGQEEFSEKAGGFLSALINTSRDTEFTIHTGHLAERIHYLGYENKKHITVKGDTGCYAGDSMQRGTITIEGDAGKEAGAGMKGGRITVKGDAGDGIGGWMTGGSITVKGDAGDEVGSGMTGGVITVEGDAGMEVGANMQGGEIRLQGGYVDIAQDSMECGRIYHKGELIAVRLAKAAVGK